MDAQASPGRALTAGARDVPQAVVLDPVVVSPRRRARIRQLTRHRGRRARRHPLVEHTRRVVRAGLDELSRDALAVHRRVDGRGVNAGEGEEGRRNVDVGADEFELGVGLDPGAHNHPAQRIVLCTGHKWQRGQEQGPEPEQEQ